MTRSSLRWRYMKLNIGELFSCGIPTRAMCFALCLVTVWLGSLVGISPIYADELEWTQLPRTLSAGQDFSVTLRYRIDSGAPVCLHVEMKDLAETVLREEQIYVQGSGAKSFTFSAPVSTMKIRMSAWTGDDWRKANTLARRDDPIGVYAGDPAAARSFLQRAGAKPSGRIRIAVLQDSLPGHDPVFVNRWIDLLQGLSLETVPIDADTLCNPLALPAGSFDMLFLPFAESLPIQSLPAVERFIAEGGDVFALGGPAYSNPLWKAGRQWASAAQWRERLNAVPIGHMLFDFERDDLDEWIRYTNAPDRLMTRALQPGVHGQALHVHIQDLSGWDGMARENLKNPFPQGSTLTVLEARAEEPTRALSLEWREKDGSRWIAVFPVTPQWQRVVLTPNDFIFWPSVPGRGGAGDAFHPENASGFTISVAWSHTGLRGGEYDFMIDDLGTAASPYGEMPDLSEPLPLIEGLCPPFKFYDITSFQTLQSRPPYASFSWPIPAVRPMQAHHPRPTGKGYGKERPYRWIPFLDALDQGSTWRGAVASTLVDFAGPFRGSVRTTVSLHDPAWMLDENVMRQLATQITRNAMGIFFKEAGTDVFTCRPGDPVIVGARVANLSRRDNQKVILRIFLKNDLKDEGQLILDKTLILPAGSILAVSQPLWLPAEAHDYLVRAVLLHRGVPIDEIQHEFSVYALKPSSQRSYITARDGDFYQNGKKWYAHGVNYMPSTGIALNHTHDFELWLGGRAYDPEFVQRDMERCRVIGFNAISTFIYHTSSADRNLPDLLRRCERLNLKVNLSLRPGDPMHFDWEPWRAIIEQNRLADWDTLFAYDIAWEPFFGLPEVRRAYDSDWQAWIEQRYGSVREAERAWGFPAPQIAGQITSPTAACLGRDGPHRKMVADYRRFMDELIQDKYDNAAAQIRRIDPHHLVSFRMTVTGDPTFDGAENMPYDFRSVAACMDFMAPEGYGRIGEWEQIKPGRFTADYARACAPGKPVLWAEAGVSVWDPRAKGMDAERLQFQKEFFTSFYRMLLESFSNGIFWWWYPGGYRTNEDSDYGILNPDGTDRPATEVIRRHAALVLEERTIPKPDGIIPIDRDRDARGLYGIYQNVKDEYWRAVEAGKHPALRLVNSP